MKRASCYESAGKKLRNTDTNEKDVSKFSNFITVKDKEEFSWDTKGAVEKALSWGQVRTQQACAHGVPWAGSRNLQCGFSH